MKTNKLKTYIRTIVRDEVAAAINEVITEMKHPTPSDQSSKKRPTANVNQNRYSSNSVLNDVLNETAKSSEWELMGDGVYDSSRMHEVAQNQQGNAANSIDTEAAAAMGVNLNKINADTTDFMTRDYSEVLKKSIEKSGR